jgi:hypothetical protein
MSDDAGEAEASEASESTPAAQSQNVGALFGAFAFLQSIGSMILGVGYFMFVFEGDTDVNVPVADDVWNDLQ